MLNNGTFPLVFQIIHQRRKLLYYTKYRIFQQQFDENTCEVAYCKSSFYSMKEIKEMNRELKREYKQLSDRVRMLERKKELYTVADIVGSKRQNRFHYSFLQYMDMQIIRKKNMGKDGTAAAYHSTRVSLGKYMHIVSARKTDIKMEDIDYNYVIGYEGFLYSQGLAENTVNYYLRNFRTIYNSAVREGYKPQNDHPFIYVHAKPCKTIKRAINREEMKKLFSLSLPDYSEMALSRDLYLFSFYAQGMAFVDIAFLKRKNIHSGILSYYRHKSKQLIHVVVTPQMLSLIDKYANASEYVFPIIDSALSTPVYEQYRLALRRINRHLKKMASALNIDVPLTTYTAKHHTISI